MECTRTYFYKIPGKVDDHVYGDTHDRIKNVGVHKPFKVARASLCYSGDNAFFRAIAGHLCFVSRQLSDRSDDSLTEHEGRFWQLNMLVSGLIIPCWESHFESFARIVGYAYDSSSMELIGH